ncbi:MAG TPA: CHC2 zinc finger domain-containing protein [Armatimonadota bacterium]|nr:CHC2 zinc finger domain-containing protein [Armatimonadota bacterium]
MKQEERSTPAFDFLARIREGVPLEETVRERVQLSGNGARRTGLCPFHAEKSPSLTVWVDENRWHCFGCGRGGSVFDFVMQAEGVEFWEAAIRLAGRYGIPIPDFSNKDKQAAAREQAVRAFLAEYVARSHELLWKKPEALAYLAKRGITEESIREYQIGYGIAIKDAELRKKAVRAGLIRAVDGQEYELQMGRLIFPIIHHGKVLQITGRTLREAKPKYISLANAGYTPIVPMGIHRFRGRQCVLVEGAIDRILLEQAGIPACSTISANFSRDWLRWLGKETRFVLAYDADANQAGQAASDKIGRLLFEAGHAVEVMELPEPHDPASYVQENGAEAFQSLMAQALPYISYWIRRQPAKPSTSDMQQILRQAYELIARVDRGVRGPFINELAKRHDLVRRDVRDGLSQYLRDNTEEKELGGERLPLASDDSPENGLPVIMTDCGDLVVTTAQSWDAIRLANQPPQYFRQGRSCLRLEPDDNGALTPVRFNLDLMRHALVRVSNWRIEKTSKGGFGYMIKSSPSDKQVKDVLATPDVPLPVLTRITEVPVFAPDGTLQIDPGYHAASRTYYQPAPGVEILELPEEITDGHVRAAMDVFEDLTCDFPFKDAADRAHAFCLWLLPFVRDMIPGPTPLHLIEAPEPGSGKSLLMDILMMPSVGRHIGTITQTNDDDEWRKRLTAVLSRAQPVVMIDNVVKSLDSGALSSALAQMVWEERILGKTETLNVPIRCVWVATANNPTMSTEIARKTIRIRIDPKVDRPWLREEFKHRDLRSYTLDNRATLIWAALLICKAWVQRGMTPYRARPLGSYEYWSRTLGGICECAGVEGFLANLTEFYEIADIEGSAWRALVEIWYERHRERPVGVSELFDAAVESELWSFGKGSERSQRIIFGKMLGRQRDRVIGDFRIVMAGTLHRVKQWQLQPTVDMSEREHVESEDESPAMESPSRGDDQETLDIPIEEE